MSIYNIAASWEENLEKGPQFTAPLPSRSFPDPSTWVDFLGFKVASRLGVFAGPLLDSRWVKLASDLGFDLLTYKTIRTAPTNGHPLPNILYIDQKGSFDPRLIPSQVKATPIPPAQEDLTITNSFGMPSKDKAYLLHDIPKAQRELKEGQLLIVSITGSASAAKGLKEDFVEAALLAKTAGATCIEANFSCPNVVGKEGSLYLSPDASFEIAAAITAAIDPIPLIIKVGTYPDTLTQTKSFIALSCAGVKAIAGINTLSLSVLNAKGEPALGPGRLRSGVCGSAIRNAALDFTREAREIIDREGLLLTLIGGGGIVEPEHFDLFLRNGADFAFTATGMMWEPFIAHRYHQLKEVSSYAHT